MNTKNKKEYKETMIMMTKIKRRGVRRRTTCTHSNCQGTTTGEMTPKQPPSLSSPTILSFQLTSRLEILSSPLRSGCLNSA